MFSVTAFGITADEDKDFNKLYMAAVDQILNIIALRFSNFWLQSDLIYSFTELKKKQDEVVKVLNAMSTAVSNNCFVCSGQNQLVSTKRINNDIYRLMKELTQIPGSRNYDSPRV